MIIMKVQWQLVNVETGEPVGISGDPFNLIEELTREERDRQFYGTSNIKEEPTGILKGIK